MNIQFFTLISVLLLSSYTLGNDCNEAFQKIYEVESRYLKVKATFEGDSGDLNSVGKVTNFQLSYTPPSLPFHPMRVIYGNRPIQMDGNDVLAEAHHNSQNSGKFRSPPTLEIGRVAKDPSIISISSDNRTLGDFPFNRLAINLKNYRFSPSNPGDGSTFVQGLLSYFPVFQPKGKWGVEAASLNDPQNSNRGSLVPVRAFERHEWDNSRERDEMMRRIHEERDLQATLPSYSKSANKISFKLDRPGLKLFFGQEGPYEMGARMNIEDFNLEFDPSQFLPGSLERRAFGSKPVRLTREDLEYASNGVMLGYEGDTCFFTLKNYSREFQSGTQVLVNRTTGQVILYPPGSKNFLLDMARGLYSETQQKLERRHLGSWYTDSDEIEINSKSPSPKRLTHN